MRLVSVEDVEAARGRILDVLQPTPLERSRAIEQLVGAEVLLKAENLQRTGSFKIRGAYNRVARLSARERARGVVCASAGNHAQGMALAAALQGIPATVVMPIEVPLPKLQACEAYGAEIRLVGEDVSAAIEAATAIAEEEGRTFLHPFDHPDLIAGQGTLALELLEQVTEPGTVLVPLGGGGLLAGMAATLRARSPTTRIVGVQAAGAAGFPPSLAAGAVRSLPSVDTIADGIAVKRPSELTLAHVSALVDEVVTVDDDLLARAVLVLLERAKLVVEPAGAAGVAAAIGARTELRGPVVPILSGGNIDPLVLQHLVASGLTAEGRYSTLRTRLGDHPGELVRLLRIVADARANIVGVSHHRLGRQQRGQVAVVLELETRGHDHFAELCDTLEVAGYPIDDA